MGGQRNEDWYVLLERVNDSIRSCIKRVRSLRKNNVSVLALITKETRTAIVLWKSLYL